MINGLDQILADAQKSVKQVNQINQGIAAACERAAQITNSHEVKEQLTRVRKAGEKARAAVSSVPKITPDMIRNGFRVGI